MMQVSPITGTHRSNAWVAAAALALSALAMWLPAVNTPFWGDDYVFLYGAHATNLSGAPWWSDFLPTEHLKFWRPLSQEGYWRLVDTVFKDSAYAAHVASLSLHILASMGVGLLTLAIARACKWASPRLTAIMAVAIYAGLAMHLLPVHWTAAANNSFLTLFTTLCLAAWVHAADIDGWRRVLLLASVPLSLALALLSKESAVLTVLLMLLVRLFTGQLRARRGDLATILVCAAVSAAWLALRAHFTSPADPAYALTWGTNIPRNTIAFVAWISNVPREAVRMASAGSRPMAFVWIAATGLPMLAAVVMGYWHGRKRLSARQWLAVALFAGIAYGPYFLLAWNSYAYYAAVAAILPVVALARCSADHPRVLVVVALLALSSWVAVAGTRHLDHPGLIGRARWGEAMLQNLEHRQVATPLWVAVRDSHRFYAVGVSGLAWRLGLPPAGIHVAEQCPVNVRDCLQIDDAGDWHLAQDRSGRDAAAR